MQALKNFNWVDILLILLLLRSAWIGTRIGLTAELFKLTGTVISIVIGLHYYNQIANTLINYINIPVWFLHFIIFAIIILLIRAVFKYGVVLFLRVLNIQFILQLERIGGALVGLGRGFLIGGLLLIALLFFPVEYLYHSIYEKSFLAPYLIRSTKRTYVSIIGLIPSQEPNKEIIKDPLKNKPNLIHDNS